MEFLKAFADNVQIYPETTCFIHRDERMTYDELDRLSNDLAHQLETNGHPLLVYGHMSKWMIVGMVAALKAGTGYVPVDISIPTERIEKIIETIHPQCIFAAEHFPLTTKESLILPNDIKEQRSFDCLIDDEQTAYTIFTSGSTGMPKGVQIRYDSLNEFIDWILNLYQNEEKNYWLNQAPLSFDLSVMAVYPSLASGGTLIMIDKEMIKKPVQIHEQLISHPISAWVSTPSFMEMSLLLPDFNEEHYPHMKHFFFCGEILNYKTARQLKDKFPQAKIYNTYGPTEATVAVTSIEIDEKVLKHYSRLPVGTPRPGVTLSLSDEGELLIEGNAVSTGYVNDAEKTKMSFYDHEGIRGYRTGDKAEYQDAQWFINGRIDYQIKMNGYRMELEEIERHLTEIADVHQAVVTPVEKNGKVSYLIASIVTDKTEDAVLEIKEKLREVIPEYMIPRKIIRVNELPMTANGKVDRTKIKEALS